jgi:hypothetical protein
MVDLVRLLGLRVGLRIGAADEPSIPIKQAQHFAQLIRQGKAVPVSHMCGHDLHVTWLAGATKLMAEAKSSWRGTLMALFRQIDDRLKQELTTVVRVALSSAIGVEGGIWQADAGSLAYAFPSYEGTG